jgi:hypothetical protein
LKRICFVGLKTAVIDWVTLDEDLMSAVPDEV